MNILHMRYALEVAKSGSLSKAAEKLLTAQPNISRSIKELEAELGITIFERSAKGMTPTVDGEEFLDYASRILTQLEYVEGLYKSGTQKKQRFSIAVPRASYVSAAFASLSKSIGDGSSELFYKETNSKRAIDYILNHDYKLGIIRFSENHDIYFRNLLKEKGLCCELVAEFSYRLLMSRENPLAAKDTITYDDLSDYIEIAHADPYVPSMPLTKVIKEELPDSIKRRIFVFERASQFDLLSENPETFMWVSPVTENTLSRYGLVQKNCADSKKIYKDVLIYKKGYKFSKLDNLFITELCNAKRKYLDL